MKKKHLKKIDKIRMLIEDNICQCLEMLESFEGDYIPLGAWKDLEKDTRTAINKFGLYHDNLFRLKYELDKMNSKSVSSSKTVDC